MSASPLAAWLALGIALSAFLVPVPLAAGLLVVLIAATVADALAVRERPRVEIDIPTMVSRGVTVPFRLSTSSTRPWKVRVRQPLIPDVIVAPNEGDSPMEAAITVSRRGRHRLPPQVTRTEGPLGLGRWTHVVGEARELLVYPDMPAARRLAVLVREGKMRDAHERGELGLGTDFESIRDYLPDDDVRRINWAATARTGRPMTNQYRIEQDRDIVCVIDSGRLMAAPLGDRTMLDAAIDAATAVVLVADVVGDHSGVIAFDAALKRQVRPRRRGGRAAIRATFDLETSDVDSDYELAFHAVGASKRSLVLVFTDIFEEAAARPLIDAVPVLTRHHHVIVASSLDPAILSILDSDPEDVGDVYAAVIASEVLEARARVAGALRLAGAEVVEALPPDLAGRCVRHYLRAKARARV
jgi:uncharacterized protein (DUF58 family)